MWLKKVLVLLMLKIFLIQSAINNGPSSSSSSDAFKECILTRPQSFGYCIGYGALSKLQSIDSSPEFDLVDGLTFTRDEKMYREGYNVLNEGDPNSFRSIFDSVGQIFSRRSMRWDMGFVHPGLSLRVAPSATSPAGVLEFAMEPLREATFPPHSVKEASTGRILTRQFLVPLLLGLKFNIATFIPIIFGIIALIAKKAIILSKLALVASSAFSIGSLLFSTTPQQYPYGYRPTYNPNYGAFSYRTPINPRLPEDDYQDAYRGNNNGFVDDQLSLYDSGLDLQQNYAREEKPSKTGRNFAWNDNENVKQTK